MKVLVTGGMGRVGAAVVERLLRTGHELTLTGRSAREQTRGAPYVRCDINDFAALLAAVQGMDAIVHLAAIPGPGAAAEEIFRINCSGTFNLYEAAARAGIRRVVTASSINAFGYNFGIRSFPVRAFPVDETQPGFSTDPYSFSKQVTEQIAEYAWRRDGISGVCLRLPYVAPAEYGGQERVTRHAELCRRSCEALLKLPEGERIAKAQGWVAGYDAWRAGRPFEGSDAHVEYPDPLMIGRTDFWTRIDERDSAQAVEKGLCADYEGCHTLFANDSHNITGVPSLFLARLFFPNAHAPAERLPGTSTLVSIDAARRLIGYEPEYSVERWLS